MSSHEMVMLTSVTNIIDAQIMSIQKTLDKSCPFFSSMMESEWKATQAEKLKAKNDLVALRAQIVSNSMMIVRHGSTFDG